LIWGKDRKARHVVFRACKDRRSLPSTVLPYPGLTRAKGASPSTAEDEAKSNLGFVWKALGHESRYSDGGWAVLYTAKRATTSYAEVGYHLQETYLPARKPGVRTSVAHIIYALRVNGVCRSFMHVESDDLCQEPPDGYVACQKIGKEASKDGIDFLEVPSARDMGRVCFPVFSKEAASDPYNVREFWLEVEESDNVIRIHRPSSGTRVGVNRSKQSL
jgi:hypothetical protein